LAIILEELYWTKFGAPAISVPRWESEQRASVLPFLPIDPRSFWACFKFALRAATLRYRVNQWQSFPRAEIALSKTSG
jgi:hypothetical protein